MSRFQKTILATILIAVAVAASCSFVIHRLIKEQSADVEFFHNATRWKTEADEWERRLDTQNRD